ncbi:MAG TPA: hypothetical protein VMT62_16085 [Syntrophorhabdaceae bacterium]|nr:hypothetical protein [Syntrophorhabdaceae bacterium]
MKILFSNRGISLIVLVIAMTLIAVLGTAFVSMMGSKQKGFSYQADSYRALNLANAGVEYAIRYVSDGLSDATNPSNNFFSNPTGQHDLNFAGGTFSFRYNHPNNRITVTAKYPATNAVATRTVALSNFRRYINPISLVPDGSSIPTIHGNNTDVPTISNNRDTFTISRIDVSIITGGPSVYINMMRDTTLIFDNSALPSHPVCGPTPASGCYDSSYGIYAGNGNKSVTFYLASPQSHAEGSIHTYTLQFSGAPPTGVYTMQFYINLWSNPFKITFSI